MTPQTRPAFELLRFTAAPVGDALALVDVEGRFGISGRFARRPSLVVEPADGERLELAPVHVDAEGDLWRAAYAIPVAALPDARFGLALRGTLVELPAPDRLTDAHGGGHGDRTVELAREANALRRQLERAEAQAAQAEDHAEAAEDRAAAAEEGIAAAQARVAVLERAIRELEQRILLAEGDAEEAERRAEDADRRADEAEERAVGAEQRADELEQRIQDAERRAAEAHDRVEVADRRVGEAEARADAAEDGLRVLRAELAEERERAQRPPRTALPEPPPPFDRPRRPLVQDEDLEGDDEDERERTPPGGIVRTRVGPVPQLRPVPLPPVRPRPRHHVERWLAVIGLVLLVVVVAALVLSIRG